MKKTTGFTKEQMLELARKIAPKFIEVDIEEKEDFFVLVLKWESKLESRSMIYKYKPIEDTDFLNKIMYETEKELHEKIQQFGEKEADAIIKSFGLIAKFKEKYQDKNVAYKVKKWYKTKQNITTNLEAYYNEKAREVVPIFQKIWEIFVKELVKHDNSKEIIDYLHGANERLKQLLFAKDRISDIIETKPSGNDTWFLVNFYISYFISLVKSLGDNLAWLVKLYCKMNIGEKKTDLAIKGFEDSLKATYKQLYRCIYGHSDFPEFRKLKEFRDIVLHKHALHVEQVRIGFDGPENVMIPIDPKSGLVIDGKRYMESKYPKLAEASDKDSMVKYGLKELNVWTGPKEEIPWQRPIDFCKKFIELVGKLYNTTYERIVIELTRKPIGRVQNYFQKIGIAVINLTDTININDKILIEGKTTSFVQPVFSMEIEKRQISTARANQTIGLKVNKRVRKGDIVFKLTV